MLRRRWVGIILSGACTLTSVVGCATAPNAAATPVAGVNAVPAATSDGVIGTLIGGALGEYGGSLIGVQLDKSDPKYRDEAVLAARKADLHPATASDVNGSDTADLNHDGYVTMDEVVAMNNAGVPEEELIRRLRKTSQIFELTRHQENFLRDDAIGDRVIEAMLGMNRAALTSTVKPGNEPVDHEHSTPPITNSTEER